MSDDQVKKQYDYHGLRVSADNESNWIYEKDGNKITLKHLITDNQKESWQITGFEIINAEYYPTREVAERKICQILGVN